MRRTLRPSIRACARRTPHTAARSRFATTLAIGAAIVAALLAVPAHAAGAHVFLDPGHGGRYSNANLPSLGVYEKNVNLAIALDLRAELERRGHVVSMSRTSDVAVGLTDIPTWKYDSATDRWAYYADGTISYSDGVPRDDLQARCNLANAAGADIFISIHNNGATSSAADGFENFASGQDILGSRLAQIVQREVVAATPLDDRGAGSMDFYVVKWSHMPAILIEGGFLTNPADRAYLTSWSGRYTLSRAVADAVDEFLDSDPYQPVWPRVAGNNRYETAAALSREGWPAGADTVLLATGLNWPDALASAPLAGSLDAPLLLAADSELPGATALELARLAPDEIVVLGGEGAIPSEIASLAAGAAGIDSSMVRRIAGDDRYETAALIAGEVGVGADGRVIVVNGGVAADAVSVAPWAGRNRVPVLLALPAGLPEAAERFRTDAGDAWRSTIVVGGTERIRDSLAYSLPSATRISGVNRYATNVAVLERLDTGTTRYYVSNGEAPSDNLTSGALGAKTGRATLLVKPRTLDDRTRLFIENNEWRISAWTMVGGEAILPYLHDWLLRKALL